MPYKNRGRKTGFKKSVRKIAKDVLNTNLETKHTDRSQAMTTYGNAGSIFQLTSIAGGSGEDQRVGEKIRVKSVMVRAYAVPEAAGDPQQVMRMIIFRDNMVSVPGAVTLPTLAALLESTANERVVISNKNIDLHRRFTILKNCVFPLAIGQNPRMQTCYLKKDLPVWYYGAGATDIGKGQLYLAVCSNKAVLFPSLAFTSRLTYQDA